MTLTIPSRNSGLDLNLASGAVVDLRPPFALDVREGALWITQTGDPADHVVGAGETFHVESGGLVVVQALEPSRVGLP